MRPTPNRKLTVISAGTLCGGTETRFSRGYNLVELDLVNQTGRLHVREMQNPNMLMPIWGPRALPGCGNGWVEFSFDGPPRRDGSGGRIAEGLRGAQLLFEAGRYEEAAEALQPLARRDDVARRLLLQCLLSADRPSEITRLLDPPASPAETIALMDALWSEGERDRLRVLVEDGAAAASEDPSVIELRLKYKRRLQRE